MQNLPEPYKRSGSSKYWLRTTVGGREIRESTGTSNYREAKEYIKNRVEELQQPPGLSFREAVVRFFETANLKPRTLQGYRLEVRTWTRFVDGMLLKDIDKGVLQHFIRVRRKEGVKDATIRRNLAFLSTLFTYMQEFYDEDAPEVNPVIQLSKRRLKEHPRLRWLTWEQVEHLVSFCQTEMQRRIIWTAVLTGLRRGELMNLTYFESRTDTGVYLMLEDREVHVVENKTDEPRVVPLSESAVRTLVGTPRHPGSAQVFWHGQGRPFTTFKNWWNPLRDRAGFPGLRFHDLRHTFATWWVKSGGDERHLQRILGHSSPQMVQRYAHLASGDLHDAVKEVMK